MSMETELSTGSHTSRPIQPTLATPWRQAGSPMVRVESTADPIRPCVLHVNGHHRGTVEVPLTAAGMRSLHDALTALLAAAPPVEPEDFVAQWAQSHGAVVYDATPQLSRDEPDAPAGARVVPLAPRRRTQRHLAAAA
jgi:hypothetical protein